MNSLEQLLEFVFRLQTANIHFTLQCTRDAIMVAIVSPSTYYEVEFFGDGHVEVQTWGPAGQVKTITLSEITESVIRAVNG